MLLGARSPRARSVVGVVVRLEIARREVPGQAAVESVAAILGNDVDANAAKLGLSRLGRDVHHHLLNVAVCEVDGGDALVVEVRDRHPIDLQRLIEPPATVNRELREADARGAADVLGLLAAGRREDDTRNKRAEVPVALAGRDRVDDFARHDRLLADVLRVDHRTLARDGNRFGNAADPQFGVDGRGEAGAQLDAFASDPGETGQGKRHGVDARRQLDDLVLPGGVTRCAPDFLDQAGARRFHGDTGQNCARGISYRPGDGAGAGLSRGEGRGQ